MKLEVQYSCLNCGITWAAVEVRYRDRGEDLLKWIKEVQIEVGKDHAARSPICVSDKCDLKIPMPEGGQGIGMRVVS